MTPGLRKLALATHLSVSVGWIGAVVAYLALDVTVATSRDPRMLRAAWAAMGLVASWAIVPLAFAAILTGLVMSLGTKWGLIRYWWVIISLVLTVVATLVLLSETRPDTEYASDRSCPTCNASRLASFTSRCVVTV